MNTRPRYGFNMLWMYFRRGDTPPLEPDLKALDFIAKHGFDFIRLPTNYHFWIHDFAYEKPEEKVLTYLDRYIAACAERKLHACFNLHRAPGYCINAPEIERHNLWKDIEAQDAFVHMWESFARRWKSYSADQLSFDLVNEPPAVGELGLTRAIHESLVRRTVAAIRAIDPKRPVVIDGLAGGNVAMPELADLGVTHSGRGYQPMALTHFEANWWPGHKGLPRPVYPGTRHEGELWNQERIEKHYAPWRAVEAKGAAVHIGEFGCYDHCPQDAALAWFADLLAIFRAYRWGYSLWEFSGPFGVIGHGRPGAKFETFDGYSLDRALFELLLDGRV